MICQNCHKNVATIHYSEVVNGNSVDLYLCQDCANLNGKLGIGPSFGLDDILASLMGFNQAKLQYDNREELICPKCNLTYSEFQKIGKLGCEKCYEVFGDKLEPILKQLHGNVQYKGKRPKEKLTQLDEVNDKLKQLKEQLQDAIKKEEYEEAARLRDIIKDMENQK